MIIEVILLVICGYLLQKYHYRKKGKLPPGPVGLPIFGYLPFLGDIPPLTITNLAKRYGDLYSMYLGRHLVVFVSDVDTMREMGKLSGFTGRHQLEVCNPERIFSGIGLLEGEGWAEWRRFTFKSLKAVGYGSIAFEKLISSEVQELCSYLSKNLGKPMYLQKPIETHALNSLWQIICGVKYDVNDPEANLVLKILNDGVCTQNTMGILVFMPWLAKLFPQSTGWTNARRCLGPPIDMIRAQIAKHEESHSPGQESDFMDFALSKIYETEEPSSEFYREKGINNLAHTCLDLYFAGSDTISTYLGWIFLIISVHPEIQRKIQEEIDEVVGPFNIPSTMDKPKMVYTEASILELMRISPASPFGILHAATEDVEFHSFTIPKRAIIASNYYQAHHNPVHWGDPEVVRPERFIHPDDGTLRRDDHVIPFYVGKRSCPGEYLAMNELFLFLTGILQKFDVELVDKGVVLDFTPKTAFVNRPPKHHVILRERNPCPRGG